MNIQELLEKLSGSEDLKAAVPTIQALIDKEAQATSQVSQLTRQIEVSNVAAKTGANAQVLLDLIPSEIKLNQDGTVEAEGKTQSLVDYVKNSPKLSLYQASIFGQQSQNPAAPQPSNIPSSILSGKSQSTEPLSPTAQALKQMQASQNANAQAVLARLNK